MVCVGFFFFSIRIFIDGATKIVVTLIIKILKIIHSYQLRTQVLLLFYYLFNLEVTISLLNFLNFSEVKKLVL